MYGYDTDAEVAIFDMARCNKEEWWPWNFMENLKSGWFNTTKYKGRYVDFKKPKIVVFTNVFPSMDKLSADRYKIHVI